MKHGTVIWNKAVVRRMMRLLSLNQYGWISMGRMSRSCLWPTEDHSGDSMGHRAPVRLSERIGQMTWN